MDVTKIPTEVSDIKVGDIIEYEGKSVLVEDVECDAVDTHMGATYLYRLYVRFDPHTEDGDEFTKWDGEMLVVLKPGPLEVVDAAASNQEDSI